MANRPSPARRALVGAAAALPLAAALPARADPAWPNRPLRVLVPFSPGGPIDQTARIIAGPLSEALGQPVVIENRTGANGVVAAETALRAPADGYSLFYCVIHHSVLPSLQQPLPYDVLADFVPVTLIATYPIILVVNPALPITSVAALIARAKAAPGQLTFSHSGYGGGTHLAGELFAMAAGVQLRQVPYRGSAPAMADLLGGHVDMMFADTPTALPVIAANKVRPLGVFSPARFPVLPDLPTIAEAGLPGTFAYSWGGIMLRAGTPPEIAEKLHSALLGVLGDEDGEPAAAADRRGAAARHAGRVQQHVEGGDRQMGRGRPRGQDQGGMT